MPIRSFILGLSHWYDLTTIARLCALSLLISLFIIPTQAAPRHAISQFGQPKYAADFSHLDYINPNAPKGGELKMAALGRGFDSFTPAIIRGSVPEGIEMLFETLTTSPADDSYTAYGLLAESIDIADDNRSVTFKLRDIARFHNGSPVTAQDVVFSFNTLIEKGKPIYRYYYADVEQVQAVDRLTVKFTFKHDKNKELAYILGQLTVFSEQDWQGRDFEKPSLQHIPQGTGPYRIGQQYQPGRYIVYERDPNYWGKDLPIQQGQYNFDRIRYEFYFDNTVAREALKAGALDVRFENSASQRALSYNIPVKERGLLKLESFPHTRIAAMQGWVFNLRRPLWSDIRIRQALGLLADIDWTNRHFAHGAYVQSRSFFGNSELEATGSPSTAEQQLLAPWQAHLPAEVYTQAVMPPSFANRDAVNQNQRQAALLLMQAGWKKNGTQWVNQQQQPLSIEILVPSDMARQAWVWMVNLRQFGIHAQVRSMDDVPYTNRVKNHQFDVTLGIWGQSRQPGNEQREYWGSAAADNPASKNIMGLKNPAIDALITQIIDAPDHAQLITRVHALDRALRALRFVVPHWYSDKDWLVYWDKFGHMPHQPSERQVYYSVLTDWWYDEDKAQALSKKIKQ